MLGKSLGKSVGLRAHENHLSACALPQVKQQGGRWLGKSVCLRAHENHLSACALPQVKQQGGRWPAVTLAVLLP